MNNDLTQKIQKILYDNWDEIKEISNYLFNNPEFSGEEYKAMHYMTELLSSHNFSITYPLEKLPTAFIAEFNPRKKSPSDTITIAFLPEYDALPGYGNEDGLAHACGHNWIAATMCGCGIVLSKFYDEYNFIVKIIGTPAEETFGGKVDMVNAHIFDDIDFAFQSHLNNINSLEPGSLAMNSIEFNFTGKAAHAAQFPDHGINALDAVNLMFSGINAMRQQFREDTRIHGIITKGGDAANIIPDYAQCQFSFRSKDKAYLSYIRKRVIDIANGAALMAGCTLDFHDYENPFDNIKNIPSFVSIAKKHFNNLGMYDFVSPENYPPSGSSDIGNVSHTCPTLYVELKPDTEKELMIHDKSALDIVNSACAYALMEKNIIAFLEIVFEIITDTTLATTIKKDFFNS